MKIVTEVSVIVPVYNQEENIGRNLKILKESLEKEFSDFEIIAVNDGSSDKSFEILKRTNFVRTVFCPENKGKGYAVRRGVMLARGEYIFFTDADLSYSPENIIKGINVIKTEKSDGVCGIRAYKNSEYPFFRRFSSSVFSFFAKSILKLNISDSQCGFKGFEKNAARNVFARLQTFRFGFDAELLFEAKKEGLKLSALPVHFTHFPSKSLKPLKDSGEMLFSLFKIKYGSRRREKPVKRK